MISLIPLFDQMKIKEALARDNLYVDCFPTDDLYGFPIDLLGTMWFEVVRDDFVIGLVFIKGFSGSYVALHGGLYKDYRGPSTLKILQEIFRLFESWDLKLVMPIKESNKAANRLLRMYTKICTLPEDNDYINVYTTTSISEYK